MFGMSGLSKKYRGYLKGWKNMSNVQQSTAMDTLHKKLADDAIQDGFGVFIDREGRLMVDAEVILVVREGKASIEEGIRFLTHRDYGCGYDDQRAREYLCAN